ncbi:unnamed protein product, partial [Allacma fusca]
GHSAAATIGLVVGRNFVVDGNCPAAVEGFGTVGTQPRPEDVL